MRLPAFSPCALAALALAIPIPAPGQSREGALSEENRSKPSRLIRKLNTCDRSVMTVAFSPTGHLLVTDGPGGLLVWDSAIGVVQRMLPESRGPVAFSPDGRLLAAGTRDGDLSVWELARGIRWVTMDCGQHAPLPIFSEDGGTLATVDHHGSGVRFWDTDRGIELQADRARPGTLRFPTHLLRQDWKVVTRIEGGVKPWADGSDGRLVRVLDVRKEEEVRRFDEARGYIWDAVFLPDGKRIILAGEIGARVHEFDTGREIRRLPGHTWRLAVASDSRTIALGGAGCAGLIELWDIETGDHLMSLEGHADRIFSVEFHPNGQTLASGGEESEVFIWDVRRSRERPDKETTSTGSEGSESAPSPSRVLSTDGGWIRSASWSPDGKRLAAAVSPPPGNPGRPFIQIWETGSGRVLQRLYGHTDWIRSVSFAPDGKTMATAADDRTVRLWDVASGKTLRQYDGLPDRMFSVAFSPDGRTVAAAGLAGTVRVWKLSEKGVELPLIPAQPRVKCVAFTPGGEHLVTASHGSNPWRDPRVIEFWDLGKAEVVRQFRGGHVQTFALSPDGKVLAAGMDDSYIYVWRTDEPDDRALLRAHEGPVQGLAFLPDNRTLVSGGADRTVRLWDVETLEELRVLRGHGDNVTSVTVAPDGRTIASASFDGTVRLWSLGDKDH